MNRFLAGSASRSGFAASIARGLEILTRTFTMSVWPTAADRARHAERHEAGGADEWDELNLLFGSANEQTGN